MTCGSCLSLVRSGLWQLPFFRHPVVKDEVTQLGVIIFFNKAMFWQYITAALLAGRDIFLQTEEETGK